MSGNLTVSAHRRVGFASAPAHLPGDRIVL